MLKKLAITAVVSSLSVSLLSAFSFDNPAKNNIKAEIAAGDPVAPVANPAPAAVKEWTIMVYINGKNNLESFAVKDMNEMEMIGSSDKVNVVTETGRIAGYDTSNGDWKGSRRYYIVKDADTKIINSQLIADLGTTPDMGKYKHLVEFAQWAKANYPAKKYMLIVWNHGSGWNKSLDEEPVKGISYDDATGNHITTPELGLALKEMGGVDVYSSDACLMQMPEVAYEIKDYVPYIVGSEETEPADGYTYDLLLGPLMANPVMTPEELGKLTVNAYADHYQSINGASTQSLLKTSSFAGFVPVVNDFVAAMIASGEKTIATAARDKAQKYAVPENKDLWHFADLVAKSSKTPAVVEKAKALQNYIQTSLITHNRITGASQVNSHGIASYIPSSLSSAYMNLAWARDVQWDEFINWYSK